MHHRDVRERSDVLQRLSLIHIFVVVFRNDSQVTAVILQLPAPADAIYEARSVMSGQALGTVTASSLVAGWNARLANATRTDVIELRRR